MTPYEHAQRLAAAGFHVFPLLEGAKLPLIEDFPNRATRDPATIAQWWNADMGPVFTHGYNVGVYCGRYGDDAALSLCVIDVDNKNDKCGSDSLALLEFDGLDFPATYTQSTPTGGQHLVYLTRTPVRNMVDRDGKGSIGRGLDIRGVGGFIVAAGSTVPAGEYTADDAPVAEAPAELIERILACGGAPIERHASAELPAGLDAERVIERAIDYLRRAAPESIKGNGGDATAYKVAAHLKDLGVPESDALELLVEHWFGGSGWSPEKLEVKIANAYRYGKTSPGASAPEAQFQPVASASTDGDVTEIIDPNGEHPVNRLNKEFAFVLIGGNHSILWETEDAEGNAEVRLLSEDAFHKLHSGCTFPVRKVKKDRKGEESESTEHLPITKMWMDSRGRDAPPAADQSPFWRRSYKGIWFLPERPCPAGWYNAWRGFACTPHMPDEPINAESQWALDAWKEHLLRGACRNNEALARWLTGWFAHLIQRPWEKNLVALVFKGMKGTGKNSLVERVADLLAQHALVTHERRYLISQFNGHMQSLLLLALDEAVWAGDKEGEGKLKGLITGSKHAIEVKGKEMFTVPNLTRVSIIGNEDWLVPASHDERRYGVFDMSEWRMKDKQFFERMRLGMQRHGGDRLLLRYLLDYDISGIDINEAPLTAGLLAQKLESLDPVAAWWLDCLQQEQIVGSDFSGNWPDEVPVEALLGAVRRYFANHNIRVRVPSPSAVGRHLARCAPSVTHGRKGRDANGKQPYVYRLPLIEQARAEWNKFVGQDTDWSSGAG